ncbi:MAG: DUF5677 domain-containing protein [Candidatus Anammoxibacter sp.]
MNSLFKKLGELHQWIDNVPHPSKFSSETEALQFFMEIMGKSLFLLRAGVATASTDKKAELGLVKRQAVIAGHMVRITKLYDGFYLHCANRQLELAGIMVRLLFETDIRILYLIKVNTQSSIRSYILTSYRSEKESLKDLNAKAKKRPLIPIEKRIRNAIRKELRNDGIGINELLSNRNWKVDGKDVRGMLKALDREEDYSYGFGSASRWIHGGWLELKKYHLNKNGRYYQPRLEYGDPDFRLVASMTYMCFDTLEKYLIWNKSDPDEVLREIIEKFLFVVAAYDDYDENVRIAKQNN